LPWLLICSSPIPFAVGWPLGGVLAARVLKSKRYVVRFCASRLMKLSVPWALSKKQA